jgi:hypothetical protein
VEQYTIIKSFVMFMALVGGFSLFFLKVRRLYQLMQSVQGQTAFKLDRIGERVMVLVKDVLGQSNVRRKTAPGWAHTLIFFGFLAVQPHSLELMIKGVCPAFEVAHLFPGLYGYEIAWWVHMLTILGFLVYIPGSKHLHLLAAVPNVFLKPLAREKAMIVTDIEDEEAESFGLGTVAELSWKGVLDLYACTECGRCEEQCPAASTGKPLSPRNIISDIKHDLFDQSGRLLAKDAEA